MTCQANANYNNRFRYAGGFGTYYGTYNMIEILTNKDWYHFACCYDNQTQMIYVFINGILDFSVNHAVTSFNEFWNNGGYVDEVRILDDECQWTEDFTPPTEPY